MKKHPRRLVTLTTLCFALLLIAGCTPRSYIVLVTATPIPGTQPPTAVEGGGPDSTGLMPAQTQVQSRPVPTFIPTPDSPRAGLPDPVEEDIYTVQYGDTLGLIAEHYGVTVESLIAANDLPDEDALSIGPDSGRITVTGNNFSNSYIGEGKLKRTANDLAAAGMILNGTSGITVTGNLFSGLRPKAFTAEGPASKHVLFSDNVVVDTTVDLKKLDASLVKDNLEDE